MPARHFRIPHSVNKKFNRLPGNIKIRINNSFDRLKNNPILGIKLKGELAHYYKLRVGDYRVVYKFNPKTSTLSILKIEHRQGVYK